MIGRIQEARHCYRSPPPHIRSKLKLSLRKERRENIKKFYHIYKNANKKKLRSYNHTVSVQ